MSGKIYSTLSPKQYKPARPRFGDRDNELYVTSFGCCPAPALTTAPCCGHPLCWGCLTCWDAEGALFLDGHQEGVWEAVTELQLYELGSCQTTISMLSSSGEAELGACSASQQRQVECCTNLLVSAH